MSLTFKVLATNCPTSMRAPGPTRMPAGLISQTEPLEVTCPSMRDGSPPAVRASRAEVLPGCCTSTRAAEPTSNELKLTIARDEVWTMFSTLPAVENVALPETTLAPVGRAPGASAVPAPRADEQAATRIAAATGDSRIAGVGKWRCRRVGVVM